jgi:mono/diheme cytochrome c family protein
MNGRRFRIVAACGLAVLTVLLPTAARPQVPVAVPAEWTTVPGWNVFVDKGCGTCHRVRGVGDGTLGPDLAGLRASRSLFDLGAAMWNHMPQMGAAMRDTGTQPPRLTPLEFSSLAAFLFTTQYDGTSGDPVKGSRLFTAKSCVQCHAVGGRGGGVGPALDGLKRSSSPVLMAAAMWNHGPQMAAAMNIRGITWPTFRGTELADLVAYIAATAQDQGGEAAPVVPGTPERGEKLFVDKGCATCHPVGAGKSPTAAPRLVTQAHRVSAGEFAGLMWNHGVKMWAAMRQRGLTTPPRLTGQEMADITAYLYTTYYFESAAGRVGRGRELVQQKGCLGCHTIYRKGGNGATDLAIDNVVSTPAGQVAAIWNHARYMQTEGRRQSTTLSPLTGQELADISAYLAGLGSGPPKSK